MAHPPLSIPHAPDWEPAAEPVAPPLLAYRVSMGRFGDASYWKNSRHPACDLVWTPVCNVDLPSRADAEVVALMALRLTGVVGIRIDEIEVAP